MAAQICFRPFQPLPGEPNPPTIDGFVEPEDFAEAGFGSTPAQVDTGWNNAARVTYVADAAVGAGRPLTVLQCLKDQSTDFIYLSFVVRRDTGFHDQDCIVLVFRPSFPGAGAAKDGTERRIDIFPNSTGLADPNTHDPRDVNYYRWNVGTSSWQDMGNNPVSNVTIKVKSWDGGDNNKNWSVEMKLPTRSAAASGGANWIDLASSFGFYSNVIRLCNGAECSIAPTPFDGFSFQFTFPRANYATGDGLIAGVTALEQAEIPLAWLAEAFLGNVAGCSGVVGVKFDNGASSIGVLSGGVIGQEIQKTSANTFVARVKNTSTTDAQGVSASFRIANWGVGPGSNAKWNVIPSTAGTSNPTAGMLVPQGGATRDLTMQWALSAAEQNLYAHPPTAAHPLDSHQCIWVQLDSVQAVDFAESSARRNMNLVPLSEHEQSADVSGDGYPPPEGGAADQEMLLLVSQMRRGRLVPGEDLADFATRNNERLTKGRALSRGNDIGGSGGWLAGLFAIFREIFGSWTVVYDWVWITDAYRKTEYELTINGLKHRIYEPAGSFGYLAEHQGPVSSFEQAITPGPNDAARFQVGGRNSYRLQVPDGGKVQVVTKLKANEGSVVSWWWWLLLLLIIIAIVYFVAS